MHKISILELVVILLTLFVVSSLIIQEFITINSEIIILLNLFETISSIIFIIDWIIRFKNNNYKFNLFNFVDLIASLPIYYIQGFKLIRLLRLIKIIKIIVSFNRLREYCKTYTIYSLKLLFFIIFTLIMLLSPILILHFEQNIGNINTAEEALWWTYCTITTIGYGDLYPVTTLGRLLTVIITLGGISLYGLLSTLILNQIFILNEKN